MAIIYSYPTATPNMNTLLLGTAVDAETGLNVTKQFSVSAIGSLIASEYVVVSELTTVGTSGAATLVSGVLNIPQYATEPLGYRTYTALVSQLGVLAPSALPLSDNVDGTIEFARTGIGVYTCTIVGDDTFTNAYYALTDNRFDLASGNYITINKTAASVLTIRTYKNELPSDVLLSSTPLEIKIFD
jgi:hypothetical protein